MARHNVFLIFWFSLFSFSYGQNNPDVTCTQERVVAAYSSDVLVTIMERLISGICPSPNFPPPPGNTNFVSFAQDFLAFQITRTGASDTIPDCQTAFQAIVDKCVKGANFWGGSTTSSGDDFNITNQNYPSDPLLPDPKLWTVVTSNLMTATFGPSQITTLATLSATSTTTSTSSGLTFPLIILPFGIVWGPVGVPPPTPIPPPDTPPPTIGSDGPQIPTPTDTIPSGTTGGADGPTSSACPSCCTPNPSISISPNDDQGAQSISVPPIPPAPTSTTTTSSAPPAPTGITTADCQALIDDQSIFPDHAPNESPRFGVTVGSTTGATDNGKSWYTTLASHGTCNLLLVLFPSPSPSVQFSVEKDVAKAYIQIGINTNTLPSQNWVTGNDSPGSLRELLALVSTGDAPQDYSETLYGGRNTACNVLTRSSC